MKSCKDYVFEAYKAAVGVIFLFGAMYCLGGYVENRVTDYQATLAAKAAYRDLQTELVVELVDGLNEAYLNRKMLAGYIELFLTLKGDLTQEELANYGAQVLEDPKISETISNDLKFINHASALFAKADVFLDEEIAMTYANSLKAITGWDDLNQLRVIAERVTLSGAKELNRGSLSRKDIIALEQAGEKLKTIMDITPDETAKVTEFYNLIKKKFPEFYGLPSLPVSSQ